MKVKSHDEIKIELADIASVQVVFGVVGVAKSNL